MNEQLEKGSSIYVYKKRKLLLSSYYPELGVYMNTSHAHEWGQIYLQSANVFEYQT